MDLDRSGELTVCMCLHGSGNRCCARWRHCAFWMDGWNL